MEIYIWHLIFLKNDSKVGTSTMISQGNVKNNAITKFGYRLERKVKQFKKPLS